MIHKALSRALIKISLIAGVGIFSATPYGKEKLLELLQFTLREGVIVWNALATKWNNNPSARTEMIKGSEELLQRLSGKASTRTESALLIDAAEETEKMPIIRQPDNSKILIIMPHSEEPSFEVNDLDQLKDH